MKKLLFLPLALLIASCSFVPKFYAPSSMQPDATVKKEFETIGEIDGPPVVVAVYSYLDKTGQRKPSDNVAHLSTAVTQGADSWVIKSLQDVGNGKWFKVVERVGLDNLIKERQLIRTAREAFEGEKAKELKPLLFAGVIVEGGIISYDTNISSGGIGARYLGIGASTQYRQDVVTVFIRMVSVQTGEILISTAVQKTILSYRTQADVFRFVDMGTKAVETEVGLAMNEPTNYAVKAAIEQSVVELIKEGERKKIWKRKENT